MRIAIRIFSVFLSLTFTLSGFALQQDVYVIKGSASDNTNIIYGANQTPAAVKDTNYKIPVRDTSFMYIDSRYKVKISHLKEKATSAEAYAKANNYNADYVFLVDMSIPSGKNRFFVYNLKKDSLECSSLVAHGFGSTIKGSEDQLNFSNSNSSYKTSLGKYKIGGSYNGTYGLAYKLYGLDTSNSKAFERAIVLHADTHVPKAETYPYTIFQSAGCPTVTPTFLPILGNYIKASKKPILMWIYY